MITHKEFIQYINDYQSFTGQKIDEKNPESLSLFFQYLQARNIIEVRNNLIEQNIGLKELINTVKNLK
jgi:hypothetical protein